MQKVPTHFTLAELEAKHRLPQAITIALGVTLAPSTGFRWATKGTRAANGVRVFLVHCRIGGQLYTTVADVLAYHAAVNTRLTANQAAKSALPPTAASQRRVVAKLKALGVM